MLFSRLSNQERYRRRMERTARWDRPITTAAERRRAWWNMVLVDHGFIRMAYLNLHKVTPAFWRSAQPTPAQIETLAGEGLKTIVNLRGGREFGSWPLEREAAQKAGIALVELTARSREAPSVEMIRDAKALFDAIEYPALIHCKSGADRAGIVAALYLILKEGRDANTALGQLSPRFGHWHWSKTGVLDAFLEKYRDEGEARGLPLLEWAENHYDPAALQRDFVPHAFSAFVVDKILRRE